MDNLLSQIKQFSVAPAINTIQNNRRMDFQRDQFEHNKQRQLIGDQQRQEALNIQRQKIGKSAPTALVSNLLAAGLKPGTPEFKEAVLGGVKKQGTVVNNVLPGAKKGTNKLTEKLAEQAAGVYDQASAAQDLASKYSQISEFAQDPNVRTGTLGAFEVGIKKLGNTVFGLEFDGLPEAEQIQKVGDMLVGDIRKMQGDTRMSDADRRAYRAIPPNIGDSKQGIMLANEIMQKTAKGLAARQQVLSQLLSQNGGHFDTNVWSQYNNYINKNPILTPEDVTAARKLSKTAKQNTPGAGMGKLLNKYGIE